jgi:hypothetical protein
VGVETVCGTEAALAFPRFICFITRGTWNASSPTSSTPPTATMIFCFFSFALSESCRFFFALIRELRPPTRWQSSRSMWSWWRSCLWTSCP